MCGIAGWLGMVPASKGHAASMAQVLHHRGPDAQDARIWPEAALVHTRLSILDLSPTGAQPMGNEDGTVWTVFNGEIYNHRQLRRALEARGHVFRGSSDTEILPHLYEEKGSACIQRLRGMFALAIYDTRTRTLLLARDRFGIKPLFYAPGTDRLAFASEIPALLRLPDVDRQPDRQAIYDFTALFYIPAPETFYKGIRALEPGELLECRLEGGRITWRSRLYHQWAVAPNLGLSPAQATEQAEALIAAAVGRQLESDVPLGALLSGGIDSSLVSLEAQQALEGSLHTFNVRFADRDFDETWAAIAVAKHAGTCHLTLDIDSAPGTWDQITDLLLHAGQPFADTSLFAVNAICRRMRQHVTAALSGDGGDEGFGGYSFYQHLTPILRWQMMPTPVRSGIRLAAPTLERCGLAPARLSQWLAGLARAGDAEIIKYLFCWMRDAEHQRLCQDTNLLPVVRLFERQWTHCLPPKASRLERLSAHTTEANTRLTLSNDYLSKVDIASMRESLEVRVPMLDEDLFAFGLSLPHRLKVQEGMCKWVLRQVAVRKLPREVALKPKHGFGIPVDRWVTQQFKTRLKEELLDSSSKLPDYLRPEVYRPMVEAFCEGNQFPGISRQGLYQRAIMLLSLDLHLRKSSPVNARLLSPSRTPRAPQPF